MLVFFNFSSHISHSPRLVYSSIQIQLNSLHLVLPRFVRLVCVVCGVCASIETRSSGEEEIDFTSFHDACAFGDVSMRVSVRFGTLLIEKRRSRRLLSSPFPSRKLIEYVEVIDCID